MMTLMPGFAVSGGPAWGFRVGIPAVLALSLGASTLTASDGPFRFSQAIVDTHRQVHLLLESTPGGIVRIEASSDLRTWTARRTLQSTGSDPFDALLGPDSPQFFRARTVNDPEVLTGDHLATDSGDVVIHPVNHASFLFSWHGRTIYNDPVGGATPYKAFPRADLILVSHRHGDHFDPATLTAVRGPEAPIVSPPDVYNAMPASLRAVTVQLANGDSTNLLGMSIAAIPAYNANHPRGTGNGYVVTLGGRRLYMSGDTGPIPETRALTGIDVAFLCMNVPFTMSVSDAASVARDFAPRAVYPYHYRNQNGSFADLEAFRRGVATDPPIEVRIRDWY